MTALLRLAVLVLLVYLVQSAVDRTKRSQSHRAENARNHRVELEPEKGQNQEITKRTDAKNVKKKTSGNVKHNAVEQTRQNSLRKSTQKSQRTIKAVSHKTKNKEYKHSTAEKEEHVKKVISVSEVSTKSKKPSKAKTKKATPKKKTLVVKEFPLNEIIFKGRASNEANAFIRANDKVGKQLELVYEQVREQDLNEIEDQIKRRMIATYRR